MGGSTCAAVGFVNVRAEQASSAQRGPQFSRNHMIGFPGFVLRRDFLPERLVSPCLGITSTRLDLQLDSQSCPQYVQATIMKQSCGPYQRV